MSTVDPLLEKKAAEQRARVAHKDRLPSAPKSGKRMAWRFQAYRDLLQRLGHGDGMAEVIEVANRDFLDTARASGDPQQYLVTRSGAQKIVVDELDMTNLPVTWDTVSRTKAELKSRDSTSAMTMTSRHGPLSCSGSPRRNSARWVGFELRCRSRPTRKRASSMTSAP